MDVEKKMPFERRGKRYRTKYFEALGELMGAINDTECQGNADGGRRADSVGDVVGQNGDKILRDS